MQSLLVVVVLVVLTVLMVSGDEVVNVTGILGKAVLLPCACSGSNLSEFSWQMGKKHVFTSKGNSSDFNDIYKGRAEVFLSTNNSNCSILLTNIRADDQGLYKCYFKVEERLGYNSVNLTVSEGHSPTPEPIISPQHAMTLYIVMPFVLVGLLLGLFLLYKRKVSRTRIQGEVKRELPTSFV